MVSAEGRRVENTSLFRAFSSRTRRLFGTRTTLCRRQSSANACCTTVDRVSSRTRAWILFGVLAALVSANTGVAFLSSAATNRPAKALSHAETRGLRVDDAAGRAFVSLLAVRGDPARDAAQHPCGIAPVSLTPPRPDAARIAVVALEDVRGGSARLALGSRAPPRSAS
jgi:hypothetical protein